MTLSFTRRISDRTKDTGLLIKNRENMSGWGRFGLVFAYTNYAIHNWPARECTRDRHI